MKKIFFIVIVISLFIFCKSVSAVTYEKKGYAETQLIAAAGTQGANFGEAEDPRVVVTKMISLALGFVGVLFTVYLMYGGVLVLMSKGEEEKITKGKNILVYGTIGILIILSAYSITFFVEKVMLKAQGQDKSGINFEVGGFDFNLTTEEDQSKYQNMDPMYAPNPAGDNIWGELLSE